MKLSIVIPVYNEDQNIKHVLNAIKANVIVPHEIIVVYDLDTDTTLPVLQQLQPDYPNLRMVKNRIARGPSGALRTGFAEALAPLVLVTMADLCDDLTQVNHLLELVPAHADIACPSRYCEGGEQQLDATFKVWFPKTAGKLLRWLTNLGTYDPTNSFKLYSKAVLDEISLHSTISFSVTLEIVTKAHYLGYRIVEIPTVWRDRQHGQTNFKLGRSLFAYFPWFCVVLLRNRFFYLSMPQLRRRLTTEDKGFVQF